MKNIKFTVTIEHINEVKIDFDCIMEESAISGMFSTNNCKSFVQTNEFPSYNTYKLNMGYSKSLIKDQVIDEIEITLIT